MDLHCDGFCEVSGRYCEEEMLVQGADVRNGHEFDIAFKGAAGRVSKAELRSEGLELT